MAYSALHGPPALDATHQWANASGLGAPPVLGDSHNVPQSYPHAVIDRINNWRGLNEIVDNRAPRTFGDGEITYPVRELGKTIVYECRLEAVTREDLLQWQTAILNGFGQSTDDEGEMTVTPWPVPGGVVWTYQARVTSLEFASEWTLRGNHVATFEWPFTITLRMSDALFYTGGVGYR